MLYNLRNPYGIDELEMRETRLQAASELERLYLVEEKLITVEKEMDLMNSKIGNLINELTKTETSCS